LEIYSSFSNDTPQAVAERYTRYGDLKKDLAALIIEFSSRFTSVTTNYWPIRLNCAPWSRAAREGERRRR